MSRSSRVIAIFPALSDVIWRDPYPFAVTDTAITADVTALTERVQQAANETLAALSDESAEDLGVPGVRTDGSQLSPSHASAAAMHDLPSRSSPSGLSLPRAVTSYLAQSKYGYRLQDFRVDNSTSVDSARETAEERASSPRQPARLLSTDGRSPTPEAPLAHEQRVTFDFAGPASVPPSSSANATPLTAVDEVNSMDHRARTSVADENAAPSSLPKRLSVFGMEEAIGRIRGATRDMMEGETARSHARSVSSESVPMGSPRRVPALAKGSPSAQTTLAPPKIGRNDRLAQSLAPVSSKWPSLRPLGMPPVNSIAAPIDRPAQLSGQLDSPRAGPDTNTESTLDIAETQATRVTFSQSPNEVVPSKEEASERDNPDRISQSQGPLVEETMNQLDLTLKDKMTARWQFSPLIHSAFLRRLGSSAFFGVYSTLIMCVWVFVLLAAHEVNPWSVTAVIGSLVVFVGSTFAWCDFRIMKALLHHFEFWWLFFNIVVVIALASWAESSANGVFYATQHMIVGGILQLLALFSDAVPSRSLSKLSAEKAKNPRAWGLRIQFNPALWKSLWFILGAAQYVYVFIMDRFFEPLLDAHPFCFLFCTDSRRIAYSCATQLASFYTKYSVRLMYNTWKGRNTLIVARFPFTCEVITLESSLVSSVPKQPEDTLSRAFSTFFRQSGAAPIRLLHISTHIPTYYTHNSEQSNFKVYRALFFRPVVNNAFLIRLTATRTYVVTLIVSLVIMCAISSLSASFTADAFAALPTLCVVFGAGFVFLELTRFDRTLIRLLARRFEWWILLASIMQYVIFGIISTPDSQPALRVSVFLVWMLFALFLSLLDAAPAYSTKLKRIAFLICILNSLRVFLIQAIAPSYVTTPVCIIFCVDSRSVAFTGLFTYTAFACKYLHSLFVSPNDCRLLHCSIALNVEFPNHAHDSELTAALPNAPINEKPEISVHSHRSASPEPVQTIPGWERHVSDDGYPFLYNPATQESKWTLEPQDGDPAPSIPPPQTPVI